MKSIVVFDGHNRYCDSNTTVWKELKKRLYTGLVDFVVWSLVLNCTEAHGGLVN